MVEEIGFITDEVLDALTRLVPELSTSSAPPDLEALRRVVNSDATSLLVFRDPLGRIAGTLTLAIFSIPTGIRARIEDVVVAPEARRQGVAEALTNEALRLARKSGARTIDLTSSPSREAANRLYERLGFTLRDTNVYRLMLG
jgi:ribosomal protein S18 acetylase RimI-like enzyme